MKKVLPITLLLALASGLVQAGAPTCHPHSGGPYCAYIGKVKTIYINRWNTILLYFDTPLDLSAAEAVGFHPTQTAAAAVSLTDDPEFGKLLYSTALSAQATKRSVSIQMRGVLGGYLKIDRIWLSE